jgi:NADPH:quinone reductase-like Zn-dependent oxidoreductase
MIEPQHHMVLVHVRSFRRNRAGISFFGVIEACGEAVVGFEPGDEVHGTASDIFADYVRVPGDSIIHADRE